MTNLLLLLILANIEPILSDGLKYRLRTRSGRLGKPEDWYLHYPSCGGQRQSPIDIDHSEIQPDSDLAPIKFINYDLPLSGLVVRHDGHAIIVDIPKTYDLRITSQSLPAEYRLAQFHFHWPSEHTINGKHLPLELHLVHKNVNVSDADINKVSTSLLVVAILFDYNPVLITADTLAILIAEATKNTHEGEDKNINSPLILSHLVPSELNLAYLRYSGSLTTPPCSEVVEFIIPAQIMPISTLHMMSIESLRHDIENKKRMVVAKPLDYNNRPLQNMNGRVLRLFGSIDDLERTLQYDFTILDEEK